MSGLNDPPVRILALSRYGQLGASSRQRMLQYVPALSDLGIAVDVRSLASDRYLTHLYTMGKRPWGRVAYDYLVRACSRFAYQGYDAWWIEKELFPYIPRALERLWSLGSPPCVIEYDDAVFHVYDQHANPLVRYLLRNKVASTMRACAATVVGSEYLSDYAHQAKAARVLNLPTTIALDRYRLVERDSLTSRPFTIGWIGTPRTSHYLQALTGAWQELCLRAPGGVRLLAIGAGNLSWEGPVEVRPWSEEREVADLMECDCGIMPLPDEPFERGKCAYKLIQYMGARLPVVASPVGANKGVVRDSGCGMLATTPQEWCDALDGLRLDPALCRSLGDQGRAYVEAHACLEVVAPRLACLLRTVAGKD